MGLGVSVGLWDGVTGGGKLGGKGLDLRMYVVFTIKKVCDVKTRLGDGIRT